MYFSSFGSRGINKTSQYVEKAPIGAPLLKDTMHAKCALMKVFPPEIGTQYSALIGQQYQRSTDFTKCVV